MTNWPASEAGLGIAAYMLTESNADDAAQAPDLLGQVEGAIASVIADGADHSDAIWQAAAARQHGTPDMVIPPRAWARPEHGQSCCPDLERLPIRPTAERGAMGRQQVDGCGRRNLVETAVDRYEHLIGPKPRARTLPGQQGEAAIAVKVLNRTIRRAKPVCMPRT